MKKSLLILSLLSLAVNAGAYDKMVPGTAEKPNYYMFVANRGWNYLTYSAEEVEFTTGTQENNNLQTFSTHLYRQSEMTPECVWAVYEGEEEGTVVIKSYSGDNYLFGVFDRATGDSSYTIDGVAGTVEDPQDIFYREYTTTDGKDFCYNLSLYSAQGYETVGEEGEKVTYYYTLDASNQGDFCTNWVPDNKDGSLWWTVAVPYQPGMDMADAVCAISVNAAVAELEKISAAVPYVDAEVAVGISQLKALSAKDDYIDKIAEIKESTMAACNASLMTYYSNKTFALQNTRRKDMEVATGAYLATSTINTAYVAATTYVDPVTSFTFKPQTDGGYVIYNEATNTYMGTETMETGAIKCVPVTDASNAIIVYACIKAGGGYMGIAFTESDDYTGNGLNIQSWENGSYLSLYSATDAGSIWNVVEPSPEGAIADIVASVENALTPYLPNVPIVADIFNKAIADVKALPYNAEIATKATEIQEQAFADANNLLATGLNNKTFGLKYLRGDNYVAVAAPEGSEVLNYQHVENALNPDAQFTFKETGDEDGSYYIYNAATDTYFGPQQSEETDDNGNLLDTLLIVGDETEAQPLYPVLFHFGEYYGIALPFIAGADATTPAINMNAGPGLHAYYNGDDGSVWGILDPEDTSIEEIGANVTAPVIMGIYDLSGRKLSAPVKGINIINGKKVLVK